MKTGCQATLQFRGLSLLQGNIVIYGGERVSRQVLLQSELSTVNIQPQAKLDKWKSVYYPNTPGKVAPLGSRDMLFTGTALYHLILQYTIDLAEPLEIVPTWPGLQGVLYESDLHGQFYMIFDNKKKLIATGDAWPKKCKIVKGKYTVRMQVRSEKVSSLEKLVSLPLVLVRHLKNSVNLSFYATKSDALIGDNDIGSRTLGIGNAISMYLREPTRDSLPGGLRDGDCLVGSATFTKKNGKTTQGASDRPDGYPVEYYISCAPPDEKKKEDDKNCEPPLDRLKTVIRDSKIKYLKSLVNTVEFDEVYEAIVLDYPDNIQLKMTKLVHCKKKFETLSKGDEREKHLAQWLAICDQVIGLIDAEELAKKYGVLQPVVSSDTEEKKNALVAAFSAKAKIFLEKATIDGARDSNIELFESSMKELQKWADTAKDAYWALEFNKNKMLKR